MAYDNTIVPGCKSLTAGEAADWIIGSFSDLDDQRESIIINLIDLDSESGRSMRNLVHMWFPTL